jgi:hypothetical protein
VRWSHSVFTAQHCSLGTSKQKAALVLLALSAEQIEPITGVLLGGAGLLLEPSSDTLAVAKIFLILPPLGCVALVQAAPVIIGCRTDAAYFEYANGRTSTDERHVLAALLSALSPSHTTGIVHLQRLAPYF